MVRGPSGIWQTSERTGRILDAETLKVLSVILNVSKLWSKRKKYIARNEIENREEYDMCQAMSELLADAAEGGRKQGINQGIRKGINKGISQGVEDKTRTVVLNMLARGMSDLCHCRVQRGI